VKISRNIFYIFTLIFFCQNIFAQTNLVPNYSFEKYNECPKLDSFTGNDVGFFVKDWYVGASSAEQYFNTCAYGPAVYCNNVPSNFFGYQYPSSGNGYIGIGTYNNVFYRNYPCSKLLSPLIKEHYYKVSFKTALCEKSAGSINKLGILFYVNNPLKYLFKSDYKYGEIVNFPNRSHIVSNTQIADTANWTEISGIFKADSNYAFLIIGNFYDSSQTTFIENNYSIPVSWRKSKIVNYFIDDIFVTEYSKKIFVSDTIVCENQNVNLFATGQSGLPYYWSLHSNGSDTISLDSIFIINRISNDTSIYLISPYSIDSVKIHVYQPLIVKIIGNNEICNTPSLNLSCNVNYDHLPVSYIWSTGDTTSSIEITNEGKYFIKAILGSCIASDSKEISYCPNTIFIPDAFTPNNDGLNDYFQIKGDNIEKIHFEIYNKWGGRIYISDTINNLWDGKFKNNPCQPDVYYYKIIFTTKQNPANEKILTGNVTIIK